MRRGLALLLAVGLALTASAARADKPAPVKVEGRVTFQGKPLQEGTIAFHSAKSKPVEAKIEDGIYKAEAVLVGPMRVTVTSKKVPLPARYAKPDTSGLVIEVARGNQKADINLQ